MLRGTKPGTLRLEGEAGTELSSEVISENRGCSIYGAGSPQDSPTPSSYPERAIECANYMYHSMRGSLLSVTGKPVSPRDWQALGEPKQQVSCPWPFSECGWSSRSFFCPCGLLELCPEVSRPLWGMWGLQRPARCSERQLAFVLDPSAPPSSIPLLQARRTASRLPGAATAWASAYHTSR